MKNKNHGWSLMELMVVTLIATFVFSAILGVFVLGRNAWTIGGAQAELQEQGRNAMEFISRELSQAAYTNNHTWPQIDQNGAVLIFRIPVRNPDPIAHSMYKTDGTLKLGVDGKVGALIYYYVINKQLVRTASTCTVTIPINPGGASWNINTKIKIVHNQQPKINSAKQVFDLVVELFSPNLAFATETPPGGGGTVHCGDHVCNDMDGENCENCPIDCGTCGPPYCGNTLCDAGETCQTCLECCSGSCKQSSRTLASNVKQVTFSYGTDINTTNIIEVKLELEKNTLGNKKVSLVLNSRVTLKNTPLSQKSSIPAVHGPGGTFDRYTSDGYIVQNHLNDAVIGPGCGDGSCAVGENCQNCSVDCGTCPGKCPNGICEPDENCQKCPADCGQCVVCGDGTCSPTETCESCTRDCGECSKCGNDICEAKEDCHDCPQDCGECAVCGDNICAPTENCQSCPADCKAQCRCGDSICSAIINETCATCEADCGKCLK